MKGKIIGLLFSLALPSMTMATIPLGQAPAALELTGSTGGRIDGSSWHSDELRGKVHMLVYSAPGKKDLNNAATEAVKKEGFAREQFASVAVVNMAASWLPNLAIDQAIKSKQKQYPDTVYVKDNHKSLVKTWNLADDNNDIVVFNKSGQVVYSHDGELKEADIAALIAAIKAHL